MNELRMYVEQLFSGQLLTEDTIELKEEIYGNLMARYEDYMQEGMSSEEALARAKESITSVDEVLSTSAEKESSEPSPSHASEVSASSAQAEEAASTTVLSQPAESSTEEVRDRASVSDGEQQDTTTAKACQSTASIGKKTPRKKRLGVLALIIVAILALAAVGAFATTLLGAKVVGEVVDEVNDLNNAVNTTPSGNTSSNSTTSNNATSTNNNATSTPSVLYAGDYVLTLDADGNASIASSWADEVALAVVASTHADVQPYANSSLSSTSNVNNLVSALPLARWLTGSPSISGSALALSYTVDHTIDGDSIDLAMVYDASTLFCALEDCSEIRFTVAESDEPYDADLYVFSRTTLEQAYGMTLNASAISADGWKTLKNTKLYVGEFVDYMTDLAERS